MSVKISEKMQHLNILLKGTKDHLSSFDNKYIKTCVEKANCFYGLKLYDEAMSEVNEIIYYLQDFIKNQLTRKENI